MSYTFLLNLDVAGEVVRVETAEFSGRKYLSFDVENSDYVNEQQALSAANRYRLVLENLDQISEEQWDLLGQNHYLGNKLGTSEIESWLEEVVQEISEYLEVELSYKRNGQDRTYTPAALWEASASCSEWDQSAQYGYDYGWDL